MLLCSVPRQMPSIPWIKTELTHTRVCTKEQKLTVSLFKLIFLYFYLHLFTPWGAWDISLHSRRSNAAVPAFHLLSPPREFHSLIIICRHVYLGQSLFLCPLGAQVRAMLVGSDGGMRNTRFHCHLYFPIFAVVNLQLNCLYISASDIFLV